MVKTALPRNISQKSVLIQQVDLPNGHHGAKASPGATVDFLPHSFFTSTQKDTFERSNTNYL